MSSLPQKILLTTPTLRIRPEIRSYDSGEECSLDHWIETYRRVQEEVAFAGDREPELPLAS